jgi:UDP-galactopyranose mutase
MHYRLEAEKQNQVSFIGRLATYRYMDMHHVIGEALNFAHEFTASVKNNAKPPVFSNTELS